MAAVTIIPRLITKPAGASRNSCKPGPGWRNLRRWASSARSTSSTSTTAASTRVSTQERTDVFCRVTFRCPRRGSEQPGRSEGSSGRGCIWSPRPLVHPEVRASCCAAVCLGLRCGLRCRAPPGRDIEQHRDHQSHQYPQDDREVDPASERRRAGKCVSQRYHRKEHRCVPGCHR